MATASVTRCFVRPTGDADVTSVRGVDDDGNVVVEATLAFCVDLSRPLRGFTMRVSDLTHPDAGRVAAIAAAAASHCAKDAPLYLSAPPDASPPPAPGMEWEVVAGGGPHDEVAFKAVPAPPPADAPQGMLASMGMA